MAIETEVMKGYLSLSDGRRGEGLEAFDRALALEPSSIEAVAGKAFALRQVEDLEGALAVLEARPEVVRASVGHFAKADPELGRRIEAALEEGER